MKKKVNKVIKLTAFILSLTFFTSSSLWAKFVSDTESTRQRLEADLGYSFLKYDETHYGDHSLDTNFNQESFNLQLTYQLFLISGFFYTKLDAQYIGAQTNTNELGDRVYLLNGNGSIGLIIPGTRPFNLTLAAEYYFTRMYPSRDGFGTTPLTGLQYFPLLDYTTPNGLMSLYLKYPLFSSLSNREEFSGGIIFRFLFNKPLPYPYASFQHAILLKTDFSLTKTYFDDEAKVKSRVQALTISLGYNF